MNARGDALEAARKALELFHDVAVDDDGALSFRHGDVPCAVQGMELAEGLTVLSLTCVVAGDLVGDVAVWVANALVRAYLAHSASSRPNVGPT